MAGYLVLDITVEDPELYKEYERLARPTVVSHGGKILLRAEHGETVEGDMHLNRLVIVEFESLEVLKRWYASPEYQEALAVRLRSSKGNVVMMEGQQAPAPSA